MYAVDVGTLFQFTRQVAITRLYQLCIIKFGSSLLQTLMNIVNLVFIPNYRCRGVTRSICQWLVEKDHGCEAHPGQGIILCPCATDSLVTVAECMYH